MSPFPVAKDGGAIVIERPASDMPSLQPGAAHAGTNPLDDQVSLEFSDGADDNDDGAAQRAARVYLFAEADELNLEPVEFIENLEEVFDRPGESIRSPDQDDVEMSAPGIPHHLIEAGPRGPGAADPVGVLPDNRIAALGGHLLQIVELGL